MVQGDTHVTFGIGQPILLTEVVTARANVLLQSGNGLLGIRPPARRAHPGWTL